MFAWIKAFHIISVVAWFAALFYLPRLFVYHSMAEDEIGKERFKVMERKLLRAIANPAMISTYIFGIWMVYLNWGFYKTQTWFWVKMSLVLILTVYHHMCVRYFKKFRDDIVPANHLFFRVFNEIPVFILVGIVIMVVVRPFQ